MDSEREKPASTRRWWLFLGGIVAFVVAFQLIESVFLTDPSGSEEGAAPTEGAGGAPSPAPPEVRRLDNGAVEIRHDFFRRTTVRLGNDDDAKALFDCLTQGVEQTFGDGSESWSGSRKRRETNRIQDECMGLVVDLPVPPQVPRPGD